MNWISSHYEQSCAKVKYISTFWANISTFWANISTFWAKPRILNHYIWVKVIVVLYILPVSSSSGGCVTSNNPPLKHLGRETSGGGTHVSTGRKFPCNGWLSSWHYYAYSAGQFYATVWRPKDDTYQLLSKQLITAAGKGVQVFIYFIFYSSCGIKGSNSKKIVPPGCQCFRQHQLMPLVYM